MAAENPRRRAAALLGSFVFLVVAPGSVAGLVPFWLTRWRPQAPLWGLPPVRLAGALLLAIGLVGLLDSFRRFALEGLGTPAPIAPPRQLVVGGLYRFVRNPMYTGVVSAILGQALLLGSAALLAYAAAAWLTFHLFVLAYEEPTLRAAFGADYDRFCADVPRWIPRLRPRRG